MDEAKKDLEKLKEDIEKFKQRTDVDIQDVTPHSEFEELESRVSGLETGQDALQRHLNERLSWHKHRLNALGKIYREEKRRRRRVEISISLGLVALILAEILSWFT